MVASPLLSIDRDQPTAAVSTADISRLRGGTDVNISIFIYLWCSAGGRSDDVICLETFFQGGKSGMLIFIVDQTKYPTALPETLHLLQYTGARVRVNDSFGVATDCVSIGDLSSSPACHYTAPFREAQTEILSLSQTDWSELYPLLCF